MPSPILFKRTVSRCHHGRFPDTGSQTRPARAFAGVVEDHRFSEASRGSPQLPLSIDEAIGWGAPNLWLWLVNSEALAGLSIHQGDVLVVDRAGDVEPGRAVIVVADCEHRLCTVLTNQERQQLLATIGRDGHPQPLDLIGEVELWGVVDFLMRDLRP